MLGVDGVDDRRSQALLARNFSVKNWERQEDRKRSTERSRDGIQTAELDRRDQVTATSSWPNFPSREGIEVDNQVAAPTESSTPNLHRATIAQRVRMEGWRQRRLGSTGTIWKKKKSRRKKKRKKRFDMHRPSHGRSYFSFAYSALAAMRMGMSGSASFQRVRKS